MPNGFIFIERSWGSLFFKHLGQRNIFQAKRECSKAGSTHLPIPRSFEENEFYRTHFGNKSLWLDISKADDSYNYQDSNQRIFSSIIRTIYNEVVQIDKYDWATFNLSQSDKETRYSREVIMLENGQYGAVSGDANAFNEAVCVYNIISEQNCTQCLPGFCQYTKNEFNETECVCPKTRRGKNCEIDLCSHCRNGGTCRISDGMNETECICPRPFEGEYCEIDLSNLGNFTLIEKPWGSVLYKHFGRQRRARAEFLCSQLGHSVHFPSPRFPEENEFYRRHFGNKSLWIEVPENMISFVRTNRDNVVINNFDWVNLNVSEKSHLNEVIMTGTGRWERAKSNVMMDTICVKDVQQDQNCTRCGDDAFCRYTDLGRNATDCICPAYKRGLDCEIDLCSNCQNNGYCQISETNQVECICPRPFDGKHCEFNVCPHCENGAYCTISDEQLSNLTNLTNLTNLENPTNLKNLGNPTNLMNLNNIPNTANLTNSTNLGESECICVGFFQGKYCEIGKLKKSQIFFVLFFEDALSEAMIII